MQSKQKKQTNILNYEVIFARLKKKNKNTKQDGNHTQKTRGLDEG